jgi:hypothetical protein
MAAWAILLGALAPTVSRWLATHGAPRSSDAALAMMEVCVSRPDGPSVIVLRQRTDQPAQEPAGHMKMDHCPLCVLHADHAGLPPTELAALPVIRLKDETPSLFLHAPRPLPVWAAALARAPPALS